MKNNKLSIEEIKLIELDILCYVDLFCRKNNINYFLVGGTLIGAVRHNGFIPWDDDIDIAMLREDYDLFLKTFLGSNEKYRLLTLNNDNHYYYPYAKVIDSDTILKEKMFNVPDLGVYIDIFPLDYISSIQIKKYCSYKASFFQNLITLGHLRCSKKRKKWKNGIILLSKPFSCIPMKYVARLQEIKKIKYCTKECSEHVVSAFGAYGKKEIYPTFYFESYCELLFEGHLFFAPIGYDAYLRSIYGDYMKLPDMEERNYKHSFLAYKKNTI